MKYKILSLILILYSCSKVEKVEYFHPNGQPYVIGQTLNELKSGDWYHLNKEGDTTQISHRYAKVYNFLEIVHFVTEDDTNKGFPHLLEIM